MSNDTKIAVVEGKWFASRNISVRSLFDLISDINTCSSHNYHYEMFNNGEALKEIITRLGSTNNIHNVYIAAHGNEGGIVGSNHDLISLIKIRNIVETVSNSKGKMHSIYFGSCNFGSYDNLASILIKGKCNQIRWIAGYTEEVDFMKSTILDALFWNLYIENGSSTPLKKIKDVCEQLRYQAPGLIEELGFKVLAWDQNFDDPIVVLI